MKMTMLKNKAGSQGWRENQGGYEEDLPFHLNRLRIFGDQNKGREGAGHEHSW